MKTGNLKNIINKITISLSIFILGFNNSFAQSDNGLQASLNFKEVANNVTGNILTSATTLLMTAAFVLFFYGIVRFIYDRSNGDDTRLEKDKEAMLWGLIALFVMVSTWGIIKLFQDYLGIQSDNNIKIQAVSFTPPPAIATPANSDSNNNNTNQNPFKQSTNKPQGADCVGKPGTSSQCDTGLYCRDTNGNTVAEGVSGTCKPTLSQEVAKFPTIKAPYRGEYANVLFIYLKNINCIPANIGGFGNTYDDADTQYVKLFQKANGLTQDGIVGPNTWTALFKAEAGQASKCQ